MFYNPTDQTFNLGSRVCIHKNHTLYQD